MSLTIAKAKSKSVSTKKKSQNNEELFNENVVKRLMKSVATINWSQEFDTVEKAQEMKKHFNDLGIEGGHITMSQPAPNLPVVFQFVSKFKTHRLLDLNVIVDKYVTADERRRIKEALDYCLKYGYTFRNIQPGLDPLPF